MKGEISLPVSGVPIVFSYQYFPDEHEVVLFKGVYPAGHRVDLSRLTDIENLYKNEIMVLAMKDLDRRHRPKPEGVPGVKYINKYIPGDGFEDILDLSSWLGSGGWVYWYGKPKHPSFMINQQLRTLWLALPALKKAILNDIKFKEVPADA